MRSPAKIRNLIERRFDRDIFIPDRGLRAVVRKTCGSKQNRALFI